MKKRSRNKTRSVLSLIMSLALVLGMCTTSYAAEEIPDGRTDEEAVVEITTEETAAEDTLTEDIPAEDTLTEEPEEDLTEDIPEDFAEETEEYSADEITVEDEYGIEVLSAEEQEDEEGEEDSEIQLFEATEENQTLKVVQKAEGTIGDDVSFTYHLYQITEAEETIENMGDIISYEPGAYLDYVIVETESGEDISDGTTDSEGTFALHVGETAEFTLEAETDWFVNQDTPEDYPLLSVEPDGEYAEVVDGTNGVVYYGNIEPEPEPEPEPEQPVITGLTVTSSLENNEKTYDGGSVTLTAEAIVTPDTAEVSYQWYRVDEEGNAAEISGATESTYTLDGSVSDSGTYKCVVTAENDGLSAAAEADVTVTINKASQNISYAVTEMDKTLGDEPFTNVLTQTTVSKDDGAGITYTSSDESVATVDENGEVTIHAAGEVTITATAAGTENYTEATASYTITVIEQPVINAVTITSNLTNNEKTYDGEEVILTADAVYLPESAEASYMWYMVDKDGNETEISGETGSNLTLEGNVSDGGTYKCVVTVTNDGLITSDEAEITITVNKADQDISYDETEVEKEYGDDAFTNPLTEGIVDGGITYSSSDESVAVVDPETGEVTIVGIGEATITATAAETDNYNGTSAGYTVTVTDAGLSLTVTSGLDDDTKVYDEDSVTLTAEASSDVDGAEFDYQWYDADGNEIEGETGVALTLPGNVADSGKYTCIVTVTYPNGETGTAAGDIEITIEKAVQSISYAETTVDKYDYDDPFINELAETLVYGDITYSFTTQMGDEPVIELDEETGEVSIRNPGVVVVTATVSGSDDYEGTSASYILTVNSDLIGTEIEVNNEEVDYDDGKEEYIDDLVYDGNDLELEIVLDLTTDELEHLTLNEITYQWYSYDLELKTFSLINGATEDTYTLTGEDVNAGDYVYLCVADVIYDNGYEHTVYSVIEIKIAKADQSIVFEDDSLTAVAGDTVSNEIITEDSMIVGDVTYKSSDEDVATVNEETGEVTIVGVGTVTITATAAETDNYNAASNSYTITTSDEVSVTITSDMEEEDNAKTYDGKKVTLTAKASSKVEGATYSYQWYTVADDGTETEIDGATNDTLTLDGNVADSGTYKCTVTVTYQNGADPATASATITITINKADQDISYAESTVEKFDYYEDFTIELTKTVVDGQITYASSDESVATVDSGTGEVHIVGPGYTTITATAGETDNYEEASASYVLIVNEDVIECEIDVNHERMTWDEQNKEWVDDLSYTGKPLELEMTVTLDEEEQDEREGIAYQWYRYNFDTQDFDEIEGATEETYLLEGDDVNAGDYIYMCVAVVTYKNGYEHVVYSPIEITINKAKQDISYEETEIEKTDLDEPFTNELTETTVSEEDGAGITYKSSDEAVATVDEDGLVTIVGIGEVTITATAAETANYAEATASYTIVVKKGCCIHWMTWDEIIEQCEEDPTVFEDCLENGCTHSVELTLNSTIADNGYSTVKYAVCIYGINQDTDESGNKLGLTFGPATGANYNNSYAAHLDAPDGDTSQGSGIDGDGAGYLYRSIYSSYRMWNSSMSNTGGWPASRVRATLNGTDSNTDSSVAGSDTLSESESLFSCFPSVLQNAIVARAVKSDTVYNSQTEDNNVTTYDKLWLLSGKELYGDSGSNNDVIRTYEGELYHRSEALGITTSNYSALMNYNETGGNSYWWLRSPYASNSTNVCAVQASGDWLSNYAYTYIFGLAPGFCLK